MKLTDHNVRRLVARRCAARGLLRWIWQSCNEFGFWQTTTASGKANPFAALQANNLASQGPALCQAVFGLHAPPATGETNTFYGARSLR